MGRFRNFCAFLVLAAVLQLAALFAEPAKAEEVIRSFDATVELDAGGELTVTENIRVRAEGDRIRRGIYRDFPLVFEDADGHERRVGFELLSVSRDGQPESYHTERASRSIRIYIGKADFFLPVGEHEYRIRYKTDRQVRFFADHDELLWNATGNFWDFPILKATARVSLPQGNAATDVVAYTGRFGSREQNATSRIAENGEIAIFQSTKPLGRREGLTVGVKFPKGVVRPPDSMQETIWLLRDYKGEIIAAAVLLFLTAYYFFNWLRIGRDPPAGVAFPRWDPPGGISPALTNYIDRKGLAGKGWDAISAAIISLAVKGHAILSGFGGNVRIRTTGRKPDHPLPVGEAAILRQLDLAGGDLEISESNGTKVQKLQTSFSSAMDSEHRYKFYHHNRLVTIGGAAMSVAGLLLLVFAGNLPEETIGFMIAIAVAGAVATAVVVRLSMAFTAGKRLSSRLGAIMFAFVIGYTAFAVPMPMLLDALGHISRPAIISAVAGIVMLNVLFFYLIGAPTPLGRTMMDGIEGLKTYISLAERDRMNLAGAPQMSPEHFETLLPYAVALRLEKPWSDAFEKWLATAVATGAVAASWQPGWYRGDSFSPGHIGEAMGSISQSIQTSMTEAMPAPKSSSSGFSGGGGSSGGGGGGGGGGGW